MQRLIRLSILMAFAALLTTSVGWAQVQVSGTVAQDEVRVFTKDSTYMISKQYTIEGTLIIEPGTEVSFAPNGGRLIVSTGGRVIADGFAEATYNANPHGYDPLEIAGSSQNPHSWAGYSDLDYFTFDGDGGTPVPTIDVETSRDATVHSDKYNYIYNVVLNKADRTIEELDPSNAASINSDPDREIISFEEAIMLIASRLNQDPNNDVNLTVTPWSRLGGKDVDVTQGTIRFIGRPVNNVSREWGHIIVLPGARAAFFRNVTFENFKKDTTVDRVPLYDESMPGADWAAINKKLTMLTNGGGGAITTFSARTWLLDAKFENNQARFRGGALQILEAPAEMPSSISDNDIFNVVGSYPSNKNPNVTDRDGTPSMVVENNPIPAIDLIDSPGSMEPLSDNDRMGHDDGRLAVYLGRMRNLKFDNNFVQLAKVGVVEVGTPPVKIVTDLTDEPAPYPNRYGNHAYGGAIYISGEEGSERRKMEIGFGINNSIMVNGTEVEFDEFDTFRAVGNEARNFQSNGSSFGSRGGAIYSGRYTSLQIAGRFESNKTDAKFLTDEVVGANAALYSMGGAVFVENSLNRLFVKGGPDREGFSNETRFTNNSSGAGGAIYVDGNSDPQLTTIVGGSDALLETRDFGFDIVFSNNNAISYGGALYSKRHGTIQGSGGVNIGEMIGYGGKFPVRFEDNSAGYAGGAVMFNIPNADHLPYNQKAIQITRALFNNNTVGLDISNFNLSEVRGGGAVYALNGDLNLIKGVEFSDNTVYNGNGGAVSMIQPFNVNERFFVSDVDQISYDTDGTAIGMTSTDGPFIYDTSVDYPADARMLTRFKRNTAEYEERASDMQGSGATQFSDGVFRTRNQLLSTYWTSTQTGYAVGLFGTIVRFYNGGDNWEYPESGTNHRLTDVEFVNANTGYLVGAQGIMMRTTDAGNTWNTINTGTLNQFNDFYSIGQNDLFAVTNNGYVFMSNDGGNTWSSVQAQQQNLNGVYFSSANQGYVTGDDRLILRTTDGGQNWEEVVPPIPNYDLGKILFTTVDKGFIIGESGTLLMSTDGGDSWISKDAGTSSNLTEIQFVSSLKGFITTVHGDIIVTKDGGETWTNMKDITRFGLHGIHFATNSVGYAVGDYGTLLKTEDGGDTWEEINPEDAGHEEYARLHPGTQLFENGIGLGGAIYILDDATVDNVDRRDTINFNRVRMLENTAYTGAAIYSDNFGLKLVFNKSLIAENTATTDIGVEQNAIKGPVVQDGAGGILENEASSDLASATLYGEVQGPFPAFTHPEAGNSIYDNNARFIIRLPDAPNTKGVLAGTNGVGFGGTDTLRGNYWGRTEANVTLFVENDLGALPTEMHTFFIDGDDTSPLPFVRNSNVLLEQGPFESPQDEYTYTPIPLTNQENDENTPGDNSLNEQMLMSGKIYDLYDKGTDIKTADYSQRIMSPIEDFAVGIPPTLRRFDDDTQPSDGKYVRRMTRDPFCVGKEDENGDLIFPYYTELQQEFQPDVDGNFYHPIGYPLYLEAQVDYDGLAERSNHMPEVKNESVFFVINETTGDFVRANFKQVAEDAPYREIFRSRVELIPDSTNRNPNSLYRRSSEGLYNFGVGFSLLSQLEDNPYNEIGASLPGRKYEANFRELGKVSDLFSNRPPIDDPLNITESTVTYFAGERYRALPVDTGDVVRIVSRTVLWKEGVTRAYDDGISFTITRATAPPEFTGDAVRIQQDTVYQLVPSQDPIRRANGIMDTIVIDDFTNVVFLTEDRDYPYPDGTFNNPNLPEEERARDSIFAITAVDSNLFYDPRALADGDNYTYLTYHWEVGSNSGLRNWLQADTLRVNDDESEKDGAIGHVVFKGTPVNPYVVPGGEVVKVAAENYPPHYRTLDALRESGLFTDEQLNKYVETFGPYFNAGAYNVDRARYLQQDTIDVAGAGHFRSEYEFRIFVVDQAPRFIDHDAATEEKYRYEADGVTVKDIIAIYEPTDPTCGTKIIDPRNLQREVLIANVTDKLRFQIDINTDDEIEDFYAEQEHNWDFRYGRTAYGFKNLIITGDGDEVIIDDVTIENEDGEFDTIIDEERPNWLADEYLYRYGGETDQDEFLQDFTISGQLNARIDRAEAEELLTPANRNNGEYNTDTAFTVVVNDGHGGRNERRYEVFVNFAPQITTESLPTAIEAQDYNNQLLDSSDRMVKVFDPNFNQGQTFELIYDDSRGDIPKDPCYEEAGVWEEGVDYGANGYTPEWLKINPESGLLYGTPDVTDAPKTETVIVYVEDEDGLPDLREYTIEVERASWGPDISDLPDVTCIDLNSDFSDTLTVSDRDFLRELDSDYQDEVTLSVIQPTSGIEISPTVIDGSTVTEESVKIVITATEDITDVPRDADGRITVIIRAIDSEGNEAIKTFRLKVSDETYFTAPIKVSNDLGAYEILEFGIADNATTGDGNDGRALGKLDSNYCEYELPPFPQQDVFDARWSLPTINGVLRNIFPNTTNNRDQIFIAQIQPGSESGGSARNYPIRIEWDADDVPARDDNDRNPQGSSFWIRDAVSEGNVFRANMNEPDWNYTRAGGVSIDATDRNNVVITVDDPAVKAFVIYRDYASNVDNSQAITTSEITGITQNPMSKYSEAEIKFSLNKSSKVTFELVDAVGKTIGVIGEDTFGAGENNSINLNLSEAQFKNLSSGAYTIRMYADGVTDTYRLMIVQ